MTNPFLRDNRTTLKVPINAPLEVVWDMLATPAGLSRWLSIGGDGQIGPGEQFSLHWSGNPTPDEVTTHRVTVWEPRRRFGFTWPSVQIVFELAKVDSLCALKLTCTYTAREGYHDVQIEELVGWTMHLMTLKSVAEGGIDLRTTSRTFAWDKGFITSV